MEWEEIEQKGREKYNLDSNWHLSAADASDPEVMQIRFNKKGPRGGFLRGKDNEVKGYIIYQRNTK